MSVGGTLRKRHWFKLALSATRKLEKVEQEKNSGECRETIRTEEGSLDRHAPPDGAFDYVMHGLSPNAEFLCQ